MLIDSPIFPGLTPAILGKVITRILLATEHGTFDVGAESVAIGLAERRGLPLATVWPLVSNPEYEAVAPHIAARAEHDIAAKITDFRLQSEAAGVLTTVNVRRGDERHKEIVAEAQSLGSELIVLRQSPQRCLLSSLLASDTVVNEVVTYSPCHTLVVPREAHIWNNRILVAVEATNQDSRIFAAAINFALQWNLPLHLLIVFTDEKWRAGAQAFVKAMRNQATQAGVAMDGEIRLGEPVMEILTFLESSHSDLIIMGSYDENHKGRSKIGGAMRKVLALSRHPVLVVRLKDK